MRDFSLSAIIAKIDQAQEKIANSSTNLQYIKALQSLHFWLLKLEASFPESAEYLQAFYTVCGFSFFDRVQNSILDYKYGNKPF